MTGSRASALRSMYRLVLFVSLAVTVAWPIVAQEDPQTDLLPGTTPSAADLAAFFDERVPELLEVHDVPGAVVSVANADRTLTARGYGFARLDPDRVAEADTPFATGSVAKLFTWTAVMQLVEEGRLGLDTDVNAYLDFEIPERFGRPITLRHLMSHTPGFEDRPIVGLFARDADAIPPLGRSLAETIPARLWPPGIEASYSNYGTALAGYIVERVSGVPFERYVREAILDPLGMDRSTFRQPLPEALSTDAALGYAPDGDGGFVTAGEEYVTLPPAGAMVMSAADAAIFMQAYLGNGEANGGRILEPETVERMRTTLFRHLPGLPGNAYGFWEASRHGERILQHAGDTSVFHTQLWLLPGRELGVYLATNAPGGALLREELLEAFLDRFYPVAPVTGITLSEEALAGYAGQYSANRVPATSLGKIAVFFQMLGVRAEDGALATSVLGMQNRWLPQGNGVFAEASNEGQTVRFVEEPDGRMAMYVSSYPMMVFREFRWYETPLAHGAALGASLLMLISGLIAFPLQARRARRRGHRVTPLESIGRGLGIAASLTAIAFVVLFVAAIAVDPAGPAFGLSPLLIAGLWAGVVAAAVNALFFASIVLAWLAGAWKGGARFHATLVALAGLLLVAQMAYWNLLGFQV